tara:strand:- start:163 stop:723 length:561 start_codon:yes stop_codon:yes gene_type:complete
MLGMNSSRQQLGIGDKINREKDDFYATPPEAVDELLKVEKFEGKIFEPCCGMGHISKFLEEKGYEVESSDLIDRGFGTPRRDFLFEREKRDNIITNPPFKLATKIAHHCQQIAEKKTALLLKIQFLEGRERNELFAMYPPARIWVFSKRITTMKDGNEHYKNGMFCLAWFVWETGYQGNTYMGWIK